MRGDHLQIRVDGDRLWRTLMEMAEIGKTAGGGSCRLALTEEDRDGLLLLAEWCRASGYEAVRDGIGNMFVRRRGRHDHLPPVMTGSHLDTVPTGGRFDGVWGVLAGLEVFRTLDENAVETDAPLELVAWVNEEGSRHVAGCTGSAVFAGKLALTDALNLRDASGESFGAALDRLGMAGDLPVGGRPVAAYLEAHVEQGPELEEGGEQVGIATGTIAVRGYEVTATGEESHIGPMPQERRRNALVPLAEALLVVDRIGFEHAPAGRTAVSYIECSPNIAGVIPGRAMFRCNIRHTEAAVVAQMSERLTAECAEIAGARGMSLDVAEYWRHGPRRFDQSLVRLLLETSERLGYRTAPIVAYAGHDAVYMSEITPTAMIIAPSVDGIGHNPREFSRPEDLAAGTNVLLHAMVALADGASAPNA